MSYSLSAKGATKAAALAALADAFATQVVANQKIHGADQAQALAAAEGFVGVLREPGENEEVTISLSGSLSWSSGDADASPPISSAAVNVGASIVTK